MTPFVPYILVALFAGVVVAFVVVYLAEERRRRESERARELREHVQRHYRA